MQNQIGKGDGNNFLFFRIKAFVSEGVKIL